MRKFDGQRKVLILLGFEILLFFIIIMLLYLLLSTIS